MKKLTIKTISLEPHEIRGHAIGWLIFKGAQYALLPFEEAEWGVYVVLSTLLLLWPITLFYTTSLVIIPTLWPKRKYVQLALVLVILYPIHLMCYFLRYRFMDWLDSEGIMMKEVLSTERFLRRYTWWFIYFVFLAIIFSLYKLAIEEIREKGNVERKLIEAQAKFLRAQLNPQFLLNILYEMRRKALHTTRELSEAICLLTEIMHYSLRMESPTDMVLISDEIKHVKNFINLNQLRFGTQIFVDFCVQGEIAGKEILPLIIISLVENACKHGELNDPAYPVSVKVTVVTSYTQIQVANKKKVDKQAMISHGIGQRNTLQRLSMAYKDNYSFYVKDEREFYSCDLKLYNLCN